MSDYIGVYVFMEKIKIGPNRVDIAELGPGDNAEPEISGGYIIKKDKTRRGRSDVHHQPGPEPGLQGPERARPHAAAEGLDSELHQRVRGRAVRRELHGPGQRLRQVHRRRLLHRQPHPRRADQEHRRLPPEHLLSTRTATASWSWGRSGTTTSRSATPTTTTAGTPPAGTISHARRRRLSLLAAAVRGPRVQAALRRPLVRPAPGSVHDEPPAGHRRRLRHAARRAGGAELRPLADPRHRTSGRTGSSPRPTARRSPGCRAGSPTG